MTGLRYITAAALLAMAGCAVGPNYKRPDVATPAQFRGAETSNTSASIADTKWFDLFGDPNLRKLAETALQQNFDLRIAAERSQQARAQLDIQRANLFPFFNGQAQFGPTRSSSIGSNRLAPAGTTLESTYTQVGVGVSWEIDLWGRLRRLNESARAQYLAAEENRNGVQVSLLGEVMDAYFTLLEQDLELEIGRKTRDIGADGLRLVKLRQDRGAASGLDVRQAEQLLYLATAQIASSERAIGQSENALNLLLGQVPAGVTRGAPLQQVTPPAELPAGLPSLLLARRPDIRAAEQYLISANAQIGAARAQYFPQISLTGFLGGQSRALTSIFTTPARTASLTPAAVLPIFQGGQIRATVRLTEAQKREALVDYEKTIYTALREVSDALIAHDRTKEQRTQQELLVKTLTESTRLSQLRYEGGLDSYLQVLDAQRNLFQSELVLAQLRLLELQSVIQLYRSLGGGWQ